MMQPMGQPMMMQPMGQPMMMQPMGQPMMMQPMGQPMMQPMGMMMPMMQGPPQQQMGDLLSNIFAPQTDVYIEQWYIVASDANGNRGCCNGVTNKYVLHAGKDDKAPIFLEAEDQSECCNRCFCSPNHGFKLLIRQPGSDTVLYTGERPGCGAGKPLVGCPAFGDSCIQEMTLHKGKLEGDIGEIKNPNPLFVVKQAPASQSMFEPVIQVFSPNAAEGSRAAVTIRGPCIYGGCSELCCDSVFQGTNADAKNVGKIKKKYPTNLCQACCECNTTLDRYDLTFQPTATPEEKVAMFTGAILTDYMLFESDHGMCQCRNNTLYITCFNCYCCGVGCPCNICIRKSEN